MNSEMLYIACDPFSTSTAKKPNGPTDKMKAISNVRYLATVLSWSEEGFGHVKIDGPARKGEGAGMVCVLCPSTLLGV